MKLKKINQSSQASDKDYCGTRALYKFIELNKYTVCLKAVVGAVER